MSHQPTATNAFTISVPPDLVAIGFLALAITATVGIVVVFGAIELTDTVATYARKVVRGHA